MNINFGGNDFYTNKAEAIAEARGYATAAVYKSTAPVADDEIVYGTEDAEGATDKTLYLVMSLGEGASDESLGLVQSFMDDEQVYAREDNRVL